MHLVPIHSQRVMVETLRVNIDYDQEHEDHCAGNFDLRTSHCTGNSKERGFKDDARRYGQKNLRSEKEANPFTGGSEHQDAGRWAYSVLRLIRLGTTSNNNNILLYGESNPGKTGLTRPLIHIFDTLFFLRPPEVTLGMPQKALVGTHTDMAKGSAGEAFVGEFDFRKWCGHQRAENNSHNQKWDSWFDKTFYTQLHAAYHQVLYTSAEPDIVAKCYRLNKEQRRYFQELSEKEKQRYVEPHCKAVYDECVARRGWFAMATPEEREERLKSTEEPAPFLGYEAAVEGESQSLWGGKRCVSIIADALIEPNIRMHTAACMIRFMMSCHQHIHNDHSAPHLGGQVRNAAPRHVLIVSSRDAKPAGSQ